MIMLQPNPYITSFIVLAAGILCIILELIDRKDKEK